MQYHKSLPYGFVALAMAALPGAASAATVTLDPFTTPQYASAPSTPRSESPAPFAIGENREFSVTSSATRQSATQLTTSDGFLDFNNAARSTGTGVVTWNGIGEDGLNGFDVTSGGVNDALFLDVVFADANVNLDFALTDTVGRTSSFDYLITEVLDGQLAFGFDDFTGDADFTSIDSIALTLTALAPAADVTLDVAYFDDQNPAPVPLPATALLLGPAVLAFAALKRRRKAA